MKSWGVEEVSEAAVGTIVVVAFFCFFLGALELQ